MAGHKRLSASKTKQWWTCPGSVALDAHEGFVDEGSGDAADLGTCAHALGEECLRKGRDPEEYRDRVITIINPGTDNEGTSILRPGGKTSSLKGFWTIVDSDMIEAVDVYVNYVRRRCVELGLADLEGDVNAQVVALIEKGTVRLETKVNPLPERDDTGGSGDAIIDAWPDVQEVVDYKHGAGVFVPVTKNHQLRSYSSGSAQPDQWSHDRYRYTIVQPRHREAIAKSPEGDGVCPEEVTREELQAWTEELRAKAKRVDEADAMLAAGKTADDLFQAGLLSVGEDGSACLWCHRKVECPAAQAKVREMTQADFADDPTDLEPPGENMLPMVLPWVPFIDKFLKETVALAERKLLAGEKVEGYKLVRKKTNRTWRPELKEGDDTIPLTMAEVQRRLEAEYGVDPEKLLTPPKEPELISGPQAEKLIPKAKRKEFSDKYLHKPVGALTMAEASDPRAEVKHDAAADFEDEPEAADALDS